MSSQPPTPADKRDRAVRAAAIALWLALAAIVAVKSLLDPENHSTFPIFRGAALAWWNGENVYDRLYFGSDYRYGPTFAMAILPLARMPYRVGAVLWALLNVGVAHWATSTLCRRSFPVTATPLLRNCVLIAALPPAAHCLYSGQTNLLVFSLVSFAAIALVDRRWWLAAVLLSAAVHVKVWPLAGALLLTACWPRRLWWRLPLALLTVAALPLLVKSPQLALDQYVQWYHHVVGQSPNRHPGYRDAWTVWETLIGSVNLQLYVLAQLAAGLLVLGLCLHERLRLSPSRMALFAVAAWTSWQLILGPGTERNTFGLIAPLTGWALVAAIARGRAVPLIASSYLITVLSSIRGVEELNPWLKTLHPVGVLLFFLWFSRWNARPHLALPQRPDRLNCFPHATLEPSPTH